jgi:hypothetical protein
MEHASGRACHFGQANGPDLLVLRPTFRGRLGLTCPCLSRPGLNSRPASQRTLEPTLRSSHHPPSKSF